MAVAGDERHVEEAGGDAHVGVGDRHDPVLAHVGGVLEVAAGGHDGVHVGDGAAVHGVPAGADDGIDIAPVQGGVGQGQLRRLVVVLVIEPVVGGRPEGRLADADDGYPSAQPSPRLQWERGNP